MHSRASRFLLYFFLTGIFIWTVVPILWMVLASFKPDPYIYTDQPKWVFPPTLEHYSGMLSEDDSLLSHLKNSLLAAGISTVASVVLGVAAGYGLARGRFADNRHLSFWIISTRMAPIAAVIIPLYLLFSQLHLLHTMTGLVLAYMTFNLPFAIWLMSAFFKDLPPSLEEAALVDGASKWQIFWHVAVPLTTPGIVTTAILCFVFAWNDYAFAATFFSGPDGKTIPVAAAQLLTQSGIDWGKLMAIGTVTVLPMIGFGLVVRRWLVRGLTLGAVK